MRLGLQSLFDDLITAEQVDKGKPDPEIYEIAKNKSRRNESDCLVIEDSIAGIKAAKMAKMKCLGLTTSLPEDDLIAAGADWFCRDFTHLPKGISPYTVINE